MRTVYVKVLSLALIGILVVPGFSQQTQKQPTKIDIKKIKDNTVGYDHLFFTCSIGSFKLLQGGSNIKGRVNLNCKGSVLITGFDPAKTKVTTNGFAKQFSTKEGSRVVYHGAGNIVIDGEFRAIQWFGTDLSGDIKAETALIRLFGEYDKNLKTGLYWYEAAPDYKRDWMNMGWTVTIPQPEAERNIVKK